MNFNIRKGLDLKLDGMAEEVIEMLAVPEYCHIRPSDFRWLKPRLLVAEGDTVDIGTQLRNFIRTVLQISIHGDDHIALAGLKTHIQSS